MRVRVFFTALLLALLMGAFFMPVYGYSGGDNNQYPQGESIIVSTSWLDNEMLRIDVMDTETGEISSLAIHICDFVPDPSISPYILIQAADLDGNISGVIRIDNPFYVPISDMPAIEPQGEETANNNGDSDNEYLGDTSAGLTPDGTGTVIDNVVTQNDIEFFTVFTEDGNEFFLVIDRLRSTDNVYLLNAVTSEDLLSLTRPSPVIPDESAIPTPTPSATEPPTGGLIQQPGDEWQNHPSTGGLIQQPNQPETEPGPETGPETDYEYDQEATPIDSPDSNTSMIIIIVIAAAVGGGAYYFKIVKGRNRYDDEDEDDDDVDFMNEDYDGSDDD